MFRIRTFCTACLSVFLVGCSDNDSVTSPGDPPPPLAYPTALEPLTEEARLQILAAFLERNPGVCLSINRYGLPDRSFPCLPPDEPGVFESEEAEEIALAFLDRNREFFHIESSGMPSVKRSRRDRNGHWEVSFENQTYQGLEVLFTGITIHLAQSVFYASGTHYPEMYIPATPLISSKEAYEKHANPIPYQCWSVVYLDIVNEPTKLILPRIPGDPTENLELRVAWQFPAEDFGVLWGVVHVDTMTGEELRPIWYIHCLGAYAPDMPLTSTGGLQ